MARSLQIFGFLFLLQLVVSCQTAEFKLLSADSFKNAPKFESLGSVVEMPSFSALTGESIEFSSLKDLVNHEKLAVDVDAGFRTALKHATENDPEIIGLKETLKALDAQIISEEGRKDFQVSGTLYSGIEDISDQKSGVAAVIDARRVIFDGGEVDAAIEMRKQQRESKKYFLRSRIDNRLYELASIWIELAQYEALNRNIEDRLLVLDPLITQLEEIAEAGIADVSRVAAAQRTVSTIRITQADVSERLALARLNFSNAFGSLPKKVSYDHAFVSNLVPSRVTVEMSRKVPLILSQYADYKAAKATLAGIKAKDSFNLGFESRLTRPFGDSGYDSDETIGVVLRKTLFNDKIMVADVAAAEAELKSSIEKIRSTLIDGERIVDTAQQTITSMERAIEVAKKTAKATSDEIIYLRRQLIIGGSTLDSVLSAEARLYDAESSEIKFTAEKRKAELSIVSALGLLSSSVGL